MRALLILALLAPFDLSTYVGMRHSSPLRFNGAPAFVIYSEDHRDNPWFPTRVMHLYQRGREIQLRFRNDGDGVTFLGSASTKLTNGVTIPRFYRGGVRVRGVTLVTGGRTQRDICRANLIRIAKDSWLIRFQFEKNGEIGITIAKGSREPTAVKVRGDLWMN